MNGIIDSADEVASLEIEASSVQDVDKPLSIRGKLNILYEQNGLTMKGSGILKHIVLVVTRGGNHFADTLFKSVIVFDDDIIETKNGCTVRFTFNLFDKINFGGAGDYYIMCSIGTVTSNIIHTIIDVK